MHMMMSILAQAAPGGGANPTAGSFLPFALMAGMVVFILLTSRSQKKREKRDRDNMHASMSKNDRVLTIGGVVGTIMSIKDEEVVLKVDESTNTKMTFRKTAVQQIISDDTATLGNK